MPARILILDNMATNRIVLKAKLLAARFVVDSCATIKEAEAQIALSPPDLMLVNLSDPTEARHAFCTRLRQTPRTSGIAIIATGVADTAIGRFAALDAGADDVMTDPGSDTFLLARLRSLLPVRTAMDDPLLHQVATRALGFDEVALHFRHSGKVRLVAASTTDCETLRQGLQDGLKRAVIAIETAQLHSASNGAETFGLHVIMIPAPAEDRATDLAPLTALRRGAVTCNSAQLIMLQGWRAGDAARALDLGADDVVPANCAIPELVLRARALLRRRTAGTRNGVSVKPSAA